MTRRKKKEERKEEEEAADEGQKDGELGWGESGEKVDEDLEMMLSL